MGNLFHTTELFLRVIKRDQWHEMGGGGHILISSSKDCAFVRR